MLASSVRRTVQATLRTQRVPSAFSTCHVRAMTATANTTPPVPPKQQRSEADLARNSTKKPETVTPTPPTNVPHTTRSDEDPHQGSQQPKRRSYHTSVRRAAVTSTSRPTTPAGVAAERTAKDAKYDAKEAAAEAERSAEKLNHRAADVASDVKYGAKKVGIETQRAASQAATTAGSMFEQAKQTISTGYEKAKEAVSKATEMGAQATERIKASTANLSERASAAAENVSNKFDKAADNMIRSGEIYDKPPPTAARVGTTTVGTQQPSRENTPSNLNQRASDPSNSSINSGRVGTTSTGGGSGITGTTDIPEYNKGTSKQ